MLNSITNSSAINYMENSLILTPVAGIIHTAVGIIKALGSLFADNKSKAFSAALGQIGHGLRNMVPVFGYAKNCKEKAAVDAKAIAGARKNLAVEAAENVVRKQAQAAVKEAGSVTSEEGAIEAAQNATEVFARRAAEAAIKDVRSKMGETAAEEAIEAAVKAAKELAAEEGKEAFQEMQASKS